MDSPAAAFKRILEVLDRLEIPYFVTDSVASSVYGIARTTLDLDLVADLREDHIPRLVSQLRADFYADPEMMADALKRGRSFNVIHLGSSYKVDIFPLGEDEYNREAFRRHRYTQTAPPGEEPIECALASPEDIVLSKLHRYRAGGEVSETQWRDLRGILSVSGARLGREYLLLWAGRLEVADLLDRLLSE
jgi:hypothetical protein